MKKILFVMFSLNSGGAERALINLLSIIDKDRYEIDLLLFSKEGAFLKLVPEYVNIIETPTVLQYFYESHHCFSANRILAYGYKCMSSNYEGMPNALMEAMGVGLPCISTDCPTGPKELLGANERGILVKPGDKEDLAVAIKYSLENVEEMKQKADLAKSYIVKRFSPSKISEMLVSELEKIIF